MTIKDIVAQLDPERVEQFLPGHPLGEENLVVHVIESGITNFVEVQLEVVSGPLIQGWTHTYSVVTSDQKPATLKLTFVSVNVGYMATLET